MNLLYVLVFFCCILIELSPSSSFGIGDCTALNYCSGHGECLGSNNTCACFQGWGHWSDISEYKAPDCSTRTCPSHRAWAAIPTGDGTSHGKATKKECSGRGICDRQHGKCNCFPGYTGSACQRTKCLNDCSGHGTCTSMRRYAKEAQALPLSTTIYDYDADDSYTAWDSDMIFACLCDSSWVVGLGAGETQEPEYFGPDCSLRHCPSGDDPRTTSAMNAIATYEASWSGTTLTITSVKSGTVTVGQRLSGTGILAGTYVSAFVTGSGSAGTYTLSKSHSTSSGKISGVFHHNETDCEGMLPTGGSTPGLAGNLCQVDCSNRGICDYATGVCKCFDDFYGSNCSLMGSNINYSNDWY